VSRRWRRCLLIGLAAAWLAAPARAQAPRKTVSVEIDRFDDAQEGAVWLAYGVSLAHWATQSGAVENAPVGVLEPSFDGELSARRALIAIWREILQKEPRTMAYMDALMRIEAAGFLREYVWTVHWRGSWKQPPAGLRIADFYAWHRRELAGHEARTGARVRVVLAPDAPASAASR
jgi:hypothetical protein